MTVLTLTTGTTFIMWLGEQITERGIGNGMSLIIFAGIVVGLPTAVIMTLDQLQTGQMGPFRLVALIVLMFAVIAAIVFVERGSPARDGAVREARRRPPDVRRVEHAHSAEGEYRRRHPGHFRLVHPGVSRRRSRRSCQEGGRFGWLRAPLEQIAPGMPLHDLLYVVGIIFFCYFYTAIIFNPDDVAENMRKYGGFIPGIRPGKRTAEYIDTILTRITLVGAIYLAIVAILPTVPDQRVQGRADSVHRRAAGRGAAAVHHRGHGRAVLLRRHVAAHHRRRRDGHRAAGRVAAHHAALRRVHEEDANPRDGGDSRWAAQQGACPAR